MSDRLAICLQCDGERTLVLDTQQDPTFADSHLPGLASFEGLPRLVCNHHPSSSQTPLKILLQVVFDAYMQPGALVLHLLAWPSFRRLQFVRATPETTTTRIPVQ